MENRQIRIDNIQLKTNVLMAPLAGYTSYPFRMLCQELGAGLSFTEMVSCNALKYKDRATSQLLYTTDDEKIKAAQLLGSDPRIMEQVACSDYLEPFDIIDINMGCPVPNVIKSGEGCALMMDKKRAASIIRSCKKSGKIVTVKCRIGMDEKDLFAAEFAKVCEDAGASMITIHGRTRNMMYAGEPYFDQIAQAKSAVSIPVIANGGIFTVEDAENMMKQTGADGIMLARGGFENPFLFSSLSVQKIEKDILQIMMEQIALTSLHYDETFTLNYIKKLVSYSMKKRVGTKHLKQKLYQCGNIEDLKNIVTQIFTI